MKSFFLNQAILNPFRLHHLLPVRSRLISINVGPRCEVLIDLVGGEEDTRDVIDIVARHSDVFLGSVEKQQHDICVSEALV